MTGKTQRVFHLFMITSVMLRHFDPPFSTNGEITRTVCANSLIFLSFQKTRNGKFNEFLLDDGTTLSP
jgi:hypothetical protein